MTEQNAQALHNGETEAQPAIALARRVVELMILAKNCAKFLGRNANAGIPHFYAERCFAAPASQKQSATFGIFQRIRKQIADHLPEQARIAAYLQPARYNAQCDVLRLRKENELVREIVEQIIDLEPRHIGLDRAGLDLVDIEQSVQHLRHGAQCFVQPRDQSYRPVALDGLGQQSLQQRQRLERLTEVMARGSEKSRLCNVGELRLP